jgi:hypothetical protein
MTTTTPATAPRAESPELQLLAERFKAWRESRRRGERIPAELWAAAVELARVHGGNRTAGVLRLNHEDLARRLSGGRAQRKVRPATRGFVELSAGALNPASDPCGTVELVQASGSRLTLKFPGAAAAEFLPVVEAFLRGRS